MTRTETKLTDLERKALRNIIHSEYMDAQGKQMINWAVWSFSVTNEQKDLAGALGSLAKKGLVKCEGKWEGAGSDDHVCWLTEDGYNWAFSNKMI